VNEALFVKHWYVSTLCDLEVAEPTHPSSTAASAAICGSGFA